MSEAGATPPGGLLVVRFLFLRLLGLVWAVAFGVAATQGAALFGPRGLTPMDVYFRRVEQKLGEGWPSFVKLPSLFWLDPSDGALAVVCWTGLVGSLLLLGGVTHAGLVALLWVLFLSVVHAGQSWYGYGWEMLLLETGFLAIFLCPSRGWRPWEPLPGGTRAVVWLLRWLLFRLMLGAGLIKIRGDECWRQLTCLQWHYETQPNPHPLSWLLHRMPPEIHTLGVGFNHAVELVAPFLLFGPRPARLLAGLLMAIFQVLLIASGNLSYFNWLTLAIVVCAFDDRALLPLVPARWRSELAARSAAPPAPGRLRPVLAGLLVAFVGYRSVDVVRNLISEDQAMNRSFDPLMLVNTYGAFGSVGKERVEAVIQGTLEADPMEADWQDYELPCKPGDVRRRPCLITPWHLRLDWQMWFVPLRPDLRAHPWLVHLAWKLLDGDPLIRTLFSRDPFDGTPPALVRVVLFRYRFTTWGEPGWWHREPEGVLLRPVAVDDPSLLAFLANLGWGPGGLAAEGRDR